MLSLDSTGMRGKMLSLDSTEMRGENAEARQYRDEG